MNKWPYSKPKRRCRHRRPAFGCAYCIQDYRLKIIWENYAKLGGHYPICEHGKKMYPYSIEHVGVTFCCALYNDKEVVDCDKQVFVSVNEIEKRRKK